MDIACPQCGKTFETDSKAIRLITCPRCQRPFVARGPKLRAAKQNKAAMAAKARGSDEPTSIKRRGGKRLGAAAQVQLRKRSVGKASGGDSKAQDYELREKITEGGMGVIYAARQTSVDREVAIKTLKPETATDPLNQAVLVAEAVVTGQLEHPNIIPVYDVGRNDDGVPFYAMKWVTGRPWNKAMEGRLLAENLEILMNVANAVAYAHSKGIIHRDIKPSNVMLGDFGEVVIMDWGEAVSVRENSKANRIDDDTAVSGTPWYMAPEMALGTRALIGVRSDVYLLGAILFEIVTGLTPHTGTDADDCLRNAASNIIQETDKEGELLDIAMKAMATDPGRRHASVQEFQQAIRAYRKHAESISLVEHGDEQLEAALETQDYAGFAKALASFEEALDLWPENSRAQEGRDAARQAYTEAALARGETDLARSLLGSEFPADSPLAERVAAAEYGHWETVFHQDFTKPDRDLAGLQFASSYAMLTEIPVPPQAKPDCMVLPRITAMWLRNVSIRGDVLVELVIRWPFRPGSLEVLVNTRREPLRENPGYMPPGYGCLIGGWGGQISLISRNEVAQPASHANSVDTAFKPGKLYRLSIRKQNDELSLWVDGQCINRINEYLPIVGRDLEGIAVRSWTRVVEILELTAWRLSRPEKTSPLVPGDTLYRNGHVGEAVDEYLTLASDFAGRPVAETALLKAYLAACHFPDRRHGLKDEIKMEMIRRYKQSPHMIRLWEADCIESWKDRRWHEALKLLQDIFRHTPDTRVVLELLECPRTPLPEDVGAALLQWIAKTPSIHRLDLQRLGLTDLSPIHGMPLFALNCAWNPIVSLEPLRGMPLTSLDCSHNEIESLEPLRGLPLQILDCSANNLTSVEPLTGMPMNHLTMVDNGVRSLDPLRGMPLTLLQCDDNPVETLAPLQGLPVRILWCSRIGLTSLDAIRGLPLHELRFEGNDVASLDPLEGMALDSLTCDLNRIASLEPLRDTPLSSLVCNQNCIDSLEALSDMTTLLTLECRANRITDLGPLRALRLTTLDVSDNPVTTLAPLLNMTPSDFRCTGTTASEFRRFLASPPAVFLVDGPGLDEAAFAQIQERLEAIPAQRENVRANRILRALRLTDTATLRDLAAEHNGHRYLALPLHVGWDEARALAERMGGHLATPKDEESNRFVQSLCQHPFVNWIGLASVNGTDAWITGAPLEYRNYVRRRDAAMPFPKFMCKYTPHWRCLPTPKLAGAVIIEWDA